MIADHGSDDRVSDGFPEADLDRLVVHHAHGLRFEDLPTATVERTKLVVLDTIGAAVAAVGADGVKAVEALMRRWGGPPESGAIGYGTRGPAHHAALVNATLARALELDDVHERALVHSTATVVPVALAVAEQVGGVDGREFLTTVAMGIDLICRLSMAPVISLGGEAYSPRSMSYTYQTGTLVGSLVAARLAGLDEEGVADAFGNAYSQCAGNLQSLAEGSLMVRIQQGLAASAAVTSMDLARAGVGGIRKPLQGVYGWFQAFYRGAYDGSVVADGLGERFEVDQLSIKPYACCKYGHNAIAAAVEIAADPGFDIEAVERVTVTVSSRDCWDLICAPLAVKADPAALAGPNGLALAQFSLPFMVSCALARRGLTVADLEPESRSDPAIVALLKKVSVEVDDELRAKVELPEPGRVAVTLEGGRVLRREVRRALGHPERPMSAEEQMEKFRWCVERMDPAAADRLGQMILDLENLDDAARLVGASVFK
jgi:2-methylcitrate dehydratase PrpD